MEPLQNKWSELRAQIGQWSLASDVALFDQIRSCSETILSKMEQINGRLTDMTQSLTETELRLECAHNEFSSLKHTQFMECRVADDDDDEEENGVDDAAATADVAGSASSTIDADCINDVIAKGLAVVEKYYENVQIEVSDSEEENHMHSAVVQRRIDLYQHRKLGPVIGTPQWYNECSSCSDESSDEQPQLEADSNKKVAENERPNLDSASAVELPKPIVTAPMVPQQLPDAHAVNMAQIRKLALDIRAPRDRLMGPHFVNTEPPPMDNVVSPSQSEGVAILSPDVELGDDKWDTYKESKSKSDTMPATSTLLAGGDRSSLERPSSPSSAPHPLIPSQLGDRRPRPPSFFTNEEPPPLFVDNPDPSASSNISGQPQKKNLITSLFDDDDDESGASSSSSSSRGGIGVRSFDRRPLLKSAAAAAAVPVPPIAKKPANKSTAMNAAVAALSKQPPKDEIDFRQPAKETRAVPPIHVTPKAEEEALRTASTKKTTQKPGKLTVPIGLRINVDALRPGGVRPKSVIIEPETITTPKDDVPPVTPFPLSPPPIPPQLPSRPLNKEESQQLLPSDTSDSAQITPNNNAAANSAVLPSVTKTRVRIPSSQRRPSTRRARQEAIRKSLIIDQDVDFLTEPVQIDEDQSSMVAHEPLMVDRISRTIDQDVVVAANTNKSIIEDNRILSNAAKSFNQQLSVRSQDSVGGTKPTKDTVKSEPPLPPQPVTRDVKKTQAPKSRVTSLFSDSDDEPETAFQFTHKAAPPPTMRTKQPNFTDLFGDDDEDQSSEDDLFAQVRQPVTAKLSEAVHVRKAANTVAKAPPLSHAPPPSAAAAKERSLFDDDEDDLADFLKTVENRAKAAARAAPIPSTLFSGRDDELGVMQSTDTKGRSSQKPPRKLFDSDTSSTESDDASGGAGGGGAAAVVPPKNNTNQQRQRRTTTLLSATGTDPLSLDQ